MTSSESLNSRVAALFFNVNLSHIPFTEFHLSHVFEGFEIRVAAFFLDNLSIAQPIHPAPFIPHIHLVNACTQPPSIGFVQEKMSAHLVAPSLHLPASTITLHSSCRSLRADYSIFHSLILCQKKKHRRAFSACLIRYLQACFHNAKETPSFGLFRKRTSACFFRTPLLHPISIALASSLLHHQNPSFRLLTHPFPQSSDIPSLRTCSAVLLFIGYLSSLYLPSTRL